MRKCVYLYFCGVLLSQRRLFAGALRGEEASNSLLSSDSLLPPPSLPSTRQVTGAGVINLIVGAAMMHSPWDFRACLGLLCVKEGGKRGVISARGRAHGGEERGAFRKKFDERRSKRKSHITLFITAISPMSSS